MKLLLPILSLSLIPFLGLSQYGTQQIIDNNMFSGAGDIHAADLDGDNDKELLVCTSSGGLWIFENQGGGSFAAHTSLSPFEAAYTVLTLDVDNDGDLDIITEGSLIQWYENDGNGSFGTSIPIETNFESIGECILADLDGDGDQDLVTAKYIANKISWFENNGSGGFSTEQVLSAGEGDFTNDVVATDLDNDGDLDLVFSSSGDNYLYWKENLGGASFGPAQNVNASNNLIISPRDVVSMDVDNDNDQDLIVSRNGDDIWWFENLGGGSFSQSEYIASYDHSEYLFTDSDGDIDLDLVSIQISSTNLNWYENQMSGSGPNIWSSNPTQIASNVILIADLAAFDLDGDGDDDLISTFSGSGNEDVLAWYENLTTSVGVDSQESTAFMLAPNPMTTTSTISLQNAEMIESVNICSLDGLVLRTYNNLHTGSLIITKDDMASGLYLIMVEPENSAPFVTSLVVD